MSNFIMQKMPEKFFLLLIVKNDYFGYIWRRYIEI